VKTEYTSLVEVMKSKRLPTQLRLLILSVAVCILAIDTLGYYSNRAPKEVPPAPNLPATQITPTPVLVPSVPEVLSRVTNFTLLRTMDQSRIEAAQTSFVGGTFPTLVSKISIYQLQYEIRGKNGTWIPVTAKVYVPQDTGSYPVFVFGSGTTGIADKCAPSLENMAIENLGNYDNQMIDQTAEGFISVFPDYEGFNTSSETQAYFVSESESKVLLGAIRSLIELQPTTPT